MKDGKSKWQACVEAPDPFCTEKDPAESMTRCCLSVCGGLVLTALIFPFMLSQSAQNPSAQPHLNPLSQEVENVLDQLTAPGNIIAKFAYGDLTADSLLQSGALATTSSLIVVTAQGGVAPSRRSGAAPFLTASPEVSPLLPLDAINRAASALESALGRPLFPLRVEAADFAPHVDGDKRQAGLLRPYAIYDASSGLILLDQQLLTGTWDHQAVRHMAGLLADSLFTGLARALQAGTQQAVHSVASLPTLLAPVLAVAIPTAFAAAPPLWFCILCPAVLGLLAPLAINFGLGQLAGVICDTMKLPDDQCFDVLIGAIGLGFVLSLASAVPIFMVCRLMECTHRNATRLLR
eukprot:CAMPEP_0202890416 /NCGR_PEP_ID=MMETSP1392-20130828/825_1 /ASSEMBLY_ACC=CAM_ASM_000868 /TAXON_ID=225041 /ORGANISM="Chlamydomonas chlamydogama, Strain SAG 11-48b" /LENGTH=349 /DNA_ID=CAMNT_0049573977 /DNA_START=63 /DNA_END=1112 /DNA_ORIENTATION=-